MIKAISQAITKVYRSGYNYHKAGVILTHLTSCNIPTNLFLENLKPDASDKSIAIQPDLFNSVHNQKKQHEKTKNRMAVLDEVNNLMGMGTLIFGAQGLENSNNLKNSWRM